MTRTRQLVDLALDGQLDAIVAERRTAGSSWQSISDDIHNKTGVRITGESLRQWFAERAS